MPTSLEALRNKLNGQIKTLDSAFARHLALGNNIRRVDRNAAREGYISALWQAWNRFVRAVVIESVRGAVKADGSVTTSLYSAHAENEIAYVAKQLALSKGVGTIRALPFYSEPTWGDISKAIQIVARINVSNSSQILSALAIPTSVNDLQTCRNACAHFRLEQINQLKLARVRYINTQLIHPSDAATWIDPTSGRYLWTLWTDDILLAAQQVI